MIVDLSVLLNEETPVYPGDRTTKIEAAGKLAKDGFCDHYVSLGTHVGTHIDAPMHMLEGGLSLDKTPIDQFVGRGVCVEVKDGNFASVKDVNIQDGDIILFVTGMSDKYREPVYFESYPVMTTDVAQYLVNKKVKMVGVDACSVDNQDGFPIHKTLLAGNVLIIENLTNLGQLVGKKFEVYALPIKLGLDGAPARVIAKVE